MIRVLVVDDHQLVRGGVCSILAQADDMEVVGEAESGEEALTKTEALSPDVVLMDIKMPGIGGIEATRTIRRRFPRVEVVAVTALSDDPFPAQLHDAGAVGFVSKGCPAQELTDAVRAAAQHRPFVSQDVAQRMALSSLSSAGPGSPVERLSSRELQVMLMITKGVSNQDISDRLHLSPKTISTYRHRLYEKLGVTNDVELTHFALRHGVVELR
jgi:two-component system invasion response regulator UvrY